MVRPILTSKARLRRRRNVLDRPIELLDLDVIEERSSARR
jgi:hypothetical protein